MKKIAVFASGNGTNMEKIQENIEEGKLTGVKIAVVMSDKPDAYVLTRAKNHNLDTMVLVPDEYPDRESYEAGLIECLRCYGIDYVVLAGYMRILGRFFIDAYRNRIINIHPSLLPAFKGASGIKDAFEYGVKVGGATVHFVDETLDGGAIILQKSFDVASEETFESFASKVHKIEYEIFSKAVQLLVDGKLRIEGRKVYISS